MFDIEYDRDLDEYDRDLDTVNIEVFKRTGFDNSAERRFRCVCCKKPICISDSFSSRGRRMICWSCYLKYFNNNILAAHAWMREGDHDGN